MRIAYHNHSAPNSRATIAKWGRRRRNRDLLLFSSSLVYESEGREEEGNGGAGSPPARKLRTSPFSGSAVPRHENPSWDRRHPHRRRWNRACADSCRFKSRTRRPGQVLALPRQACRPLVLLVCVHGLRDEKRLPTHLVPSSLALFARNFPQGLSDSAWWNWFPLSFDGVARADVAASHIAGETR